MLSNREKDILAQLLTGKSDAEIASVLNINRNMVRCDMEKLFEKFGIYDGAKRTKLAVERYYRLNPDKQPRV